MAMSYSRSNASGKNEIDVIDVAGLIVFPAMAGFILGIFEFTISVFGQYDLAEPIWTGYGAEVSLALVLYLAAIAWIIATNEIDGSDYESWELALMGGTVAAVPLYAFVPAVEAALNSHDILLVAVWIGTSAAAVYISYTE